jgi:hypothetical protein
LQMHDIYLIHTMVDHKPDIFLCAEEHLSHSYIYMEEFVRIEIR